MCGIVGYIGARDAAPIIINGLKRLEYRGYDSAGIAVVSGKQLEVRKDAGKLSQLIDLVGRAPITGAPGIGHTRWATHGAPNAINAHPHVGAGSRVAVVQNVIVENYLELKEDLHYLLLPPLPSPKTTRSWARRSPDWPDTSMRLSTAS